MVTSVHNTERQQVLPSQRKRATLPRFSGPGLAAVFSTLEQRPMLDLVSRDIMCYNVPQFSMARTKEELLDMAPNSLGLMSVTVGSMLTLPRLLRTMVSGLTGLSVDALKKELTPGLIQKMPAKDKLARLAVSGGFFFPLGAAYMSTPYFRNWLTLKRTGTADFEQIIGLKTSSGNQQDYQQKLDEQKLMMGRIIATGLGLGAVSVLGFSAMSKGAKKGVKNMAGNGGKLLNTLFQQFSLRGKTSSEVRGPLATMMFWLLPPYFGWLMAARSRNERIEYAVKACNSVLWFCLFTPIFVKDTFLKKFDKLGISTGAKGTQNRWVRSIQGTIPDYADLARMKLSKSEMAKALKFKNQYAIASWVVPVFMLAVTPQLINIYFTRKRVAAVQKAIQPSFVANDASVPLSAAKFPLPNFISPYTHLNPQPPTERNHPLWNNRIK